jgi:transposase
MSLHPEPIEPVPAETARVARAAFPRGNVCLQIRDVMGSIYVDEDFVDLFPRRGQAAEAPWRLALVTVLQFTEGLSDRQAANAVRDASIGNTRWACRSRILASISACSANSAHVLSLGRPSNASWMCC